MQPNIIKIVLQRNLAFLYSLLNYRVIIIIIIMNNDNFLAKLCWLYLLYAKWYL